MEPWAQYLLKEQRGWTRAAEAFRLLRAQKCFNKASNAQIRRAVFNAATRTNLSFVPCDKRKHGSAWGHWPPVSRYDHVYGLNSASARLFGDEPPPAPPKHYRDLYATYPGFSKWRRFSAGTPDRDEYFDSVWNDMVVAFKKDGLPIPPYPWARFRPLLLTCKRLGSAAAALPFCCPLCRDNRSGYCELHGEWFQESSGVYHAMFCCYECDSLLRAREHSAIRSRRIRIDTMNAPRQSHVPIAARRTRERAILRAVYELGLINPGEVK